MRDARHAIGIALTGVAADVNDEQYAKEAAKEATKADEDKPDSLTKSWALGLRMQELEGVRKVSCLHYTQ